MDRRNKMNIPPPRMQEILYHDLIFPEETLEIRKKAREFAVKEISPVAHEIAHLEEKRENFPSHVFYKLAENDFFKIPFPKEVGGLGLKYPVCGTVVTIEEL